MRGAPHPRQGEGTKFLAHALGYGQKLGFRVIPLVPGKKIPLIPNWQNEATTDEAKIREWWTKWPNANIGIVTGEYRDGYFVVIDFDPRNGGDWWDDVGADILPETWVVHTPSGGRHYYYKTTEPLRSAKLPDGVDLKGVGGYVVAPPSVLLDEKGEGIGEWDFQLGNMPKDMGMAIRTPVDLDILREVRGGANGVGGSGGKSGKGADGGRSLWLMPPPIPKGMRHDYLVSLGGALWAAGLTENEIERVLWAALELFATLDEFEPEREIPNIVKGLQKWEGETYTIGSLLQMLPEKTAAVVRRALTGGAVASEPEPTPTPTPAPEPVADGGGVANRSGAGGETQLKGATPPQTEADGDGEGNEPPKSIGQSDAGEAGDGVGRAAKLTAAAIVCKLKVRQKEGGELCYVYRGEDGDVIEAPYTPKGAQAILERLGVRLALKEVRRLLDLMGPKEEEAKEKKGRKSKTADLEDIKAILWRYKWVKWQGTLWQVSKPLLFRADLDRIHGLLKQNGLDVGKETLKSYMADILAFIPKKRLEGLVVTGELTYGVVGGLSGLWVRHFGDLYLVTPNETRVFPVGQWPDGVYTLDLGEAGVLPDWDGEVIHLLKYFEGITRRFKGNPKVALAMYLPMLFGQGHIGLILRGPARSGKSTLSNALAYLRLGRKPYTPSGGANMRDILAVLHREQIVFFDEVNTFSNELQETLKRMITGDGTAMRALYTDLEKVETELSGSAVFCTTNLERLASDLRTRCFVWDLEEKGGSLSATEILAFCGQLWRQALGGAIKLYQQAAKLKPPPNSLLPQVRFRDWLSWAYRYAIVLGVEKEFVAYVAKSKRAAHKGDSYEFILDAITHPNFDPQKEYTIGELIELGAAPPDQAKRVKHALNRDGVRADLIALAQDAGYNLRIEKGREKTNRKERYIFIFSPPETSEGSYLRELLQSVGIAPDWAGDVALPVEPLPQSGQVPTPEVHPPTPAPQIALTDLPRSLSEVKQAVRKAPPAPEPVAVAGEGLPADVGGGHAVDTLPQIMADYLKASRELQEKIPAGGEAPKEPELFLVLVETARAVEKLGELFTLLREREGDNIKTLTWGYRVLRACMFGHLGMLRGQAALQGHSLELLPHPKVGWAVARRVLQELEGVLNGEEVSLWPLPKLRKAPTDPDPILPPIEAEPKWREAWELFAQIPPGHPAWLAILKGLDPDPTRDWEYHTKHLLIRSLLNGEAIDPPF